MFVLGADRHGICGILLWCVVMNMKQRMGIKQHLSKTEIFYLGYFAKKSFLLSKTKIGVSSNFEQ